MLTTKSLYLKAEKRYAAILRLKLQRAIARMQETQTTR